MTPRRPSLNSAPHSKLPATRPSHICTGSRLEGTRARYTGQRQFTRSGREARYCTPPRNIFPSSLGLPAHRHRLFRPRVALLSVRRVPIVVSRRTIPHFGRRLGEHGEQAHAAHVPETVIVYNNATSHERITDVATDLYSLGNVSRLDGPKKFR